MSFHRTPLSAFLGLIALPALCAFAVTPATKPSTTKPSTHPAAGVTPYSAKDRDTVLIESKTDHFSFRMLKDWASQPQGSNSDSQFGYTLPGPKGRAKGMPPEIPPELMVMSNQPFHAGETMDELIDEARKPMDTSKQTVIRDEPAMIGDQPAHRIDMQSIAETTMSDSRGKTTKMTSKIINEHFLCIHEGKRYDLMLTSSDKEFETRSKVFARIAASFSWTDANAATDAAKK